MKLNPFNKRREQIGTTIVASARRIRLEDPDDVKRWIKKPEEWQKWAWNYYDLNGQLKYGINFLGGACSKVRLFVAKVDPDKPNDDPTAVTSGPAPEALDLLRDGLGGHSELLRRACVNLSVPGEFYVIGLDERTEEQPVDKAVPFGEKHTVVTVEESWGIYSTDEVTVDSSGKIKLRMAGEEGAKEKEIEVDPKNDFILRVWFPHARFGNQPDSPVHGILGDLEDLLDLRRMMRACDRSRAGAGAFIWPTEETAGTTDPSQQATTTGDERKDPVMKLLEEAVVAAIEDPDSPERVAPTLLRVAARNASLPRHIDFGRKVTAEDLQRWDRLTDSMEQGINLPVGAITGVKDVNHWGAWQIDESTWTGHVEPLILVLCSSLTTGFLRPFLTAERGEDEQGRAQAPLMSEDEAANLVIWYDAEGLVADPDPAASADAAWDRKAISWKTYRERRGFKETDAPSDEELQVRIGMERGTIDNATGLALLQLIRPDLVPSPDAVPAPTSDVPPGDDGQGEEPPPADEAPPGGDNVVTVAAGLPQGHALAAAAPRRAPRDLGSRLTTIDRDLRLRLQTSWHAAMRRALDRAGSKALSTRSIPRQVKRDLGLQRRPLIDVIPMIGPERLRTFGLEEDQLLEGAFAPLEGEFKEWAGRAQQRALSLIPRLPNHARDRAAAELSTNLDAAWETAHTSLLDLARKLLYNPAPDAPVVGEFEAGVLVPHGMVREIVSRAGGHTLSAAWEGIGNGPVIGNLLRDQGVRSKGYRWVYGDYPRTNPFLPHEELDGIEFKNFDDEALVNAESFPATSFFMPGDHDGCVCDFEQILEDTEAQPIAASA